MAYDYYYDDRYDAPDFMDETDMDWWDTLAERVVAWMCTDNDLLEQYSEEEFPVELVNEYMDAYIDAHGDLVCELYDRWLDETSFFD